MKNKNKHIYIKYLWQVRARNLNIQYFNWNNGKECSKFLSHINIIAYETLGSLQSAISIVYFISICFIIDTFPDRLYFIIG